MTATVLALVIGAAFAHAAWNFLAKGAEGGVGFVWLSSLAATLLWVPVLVFAEAADLTWAAIGLMAGSGALHALYFALLQRGYATGDLSLVYPLARGTGPLLSTTAAIVVLGERPSLLAVVGAAIVVTAVFSLVARPGARRGRAVRGAHRRRDRGLHAVGQAGGRRRRPSTRSSTTGAPTPFNLAALERCGSRGAAGASGRRGTGRAGGPSASACCRRWRTS